MKNSFKLMLTTLIASLFLTPAFIAQQSQSVVTFFHGGKISFTTPARNPVEGRPIEPVTVCAAFAPMPQCYTPPKSTPPYADNPKVKVIELKPGLDTLLFEVEATGGSGSRHLLSLLEPGKNRALSSLTSDVTFSGESEYRFWTVPTVSDMPVLVIADAFWSSGESHYAKHRFFVSTYAFDPKLHIYSLLDKYLTSGKYSSLDDVSVINVLEPERDEILARLKRQH
jgi:hypothetical protein